MRSFFVGKYLLLVLVLAADAVWAQPDDEALAFAQRWAQVQYSLSGQSQVAGFDALITDITAALADTPDSADLLIWRGIASASLAGSKGGLGALSLVKAARQDFERAITINGEAQHGAAYTSLGSLFYQVPGWPLSFGDNEKAERNLRRGLSLAPADIDANYFYADFLVEQGRLNEARVYILKAEAAADRPQRALADEGRRKQVAELKKKIE